MCIILSSSIPKLARYKLSESTTVLDKDADKNKTHNLCSVAFTLKFCRFRNNIKKTTRLARIVTYTMPLFVNMLVAKYKHVIRKDCRFM